MRYFALLILAFAVGTGLALLALWVAPGAVPGARGWLDAWPLLMLGAGVAIGGAAAFRRVDARAWALGALAWAFGVLAITELPTAPSTYHLGDGPWLYPVYLAIALGAGLYAVVGLRGHTQEERVAALLVFFTVANGKLLSRGEVMVFPLLVAAVALGFVGANRRFTLRELLTGRARPVAGLAALLVVWTLIASRLGDSPTHGLVFWSHLATGALLAWTLAGSVGPRGASRAFEALLVGLGLSFAVLAVGLTEASRTLGWSWLPYTRLRLFNLHPGLIAPFLSVGLCLALARAAAERRRPARALPYAALATLAAGALWMNEARASLLGAAAGVATLALAAGRWLPRRSRLIGAALVVALVAGPALFLSPLGDGVRAKLEAKTHTPSALGQRYHYWQMAAGAMHRDPLFGQGLRSEWARTDLAPPSHLDGGDQGLHAHNLFLSIGEAAGIPALVLAVLLVLGALELGRRAALREDPSEGPGRLLAAGLTAGLVAHVVANLLSMGQARLTILPLFVWVAIGLLGAQLAGEPKEQEPREPSVARLAAAVALFFLFAAKPTVGHVAVTRGRAALADGDAERAVELFETALRFHAFDKSPHIEVAKAHFQLGEGEEAVRSIERACESSPRRASWHFTRGAALMQVDRAADAIDAFERAFELNPRGRRAGDFLAARGWAHLRLGEVDAARETLTEALRRGSTYWKSIPKVRLPAQPDDGPNAARLAFVIGAADSAANLPLNDLVDALRGEALAALEQDPPDVVTSRRLVGRSIEVYRTQGLWREPLELMEAYAARVPDRYSSTDTMYVRLLCDAGRFDEAERIAARTLGVRSHVPAQEMMRYYRTRWRSSHDPKILELGQSLVGVLDTLHRDDVWFHRGKFFEVYGFLAELALRRGDLAQAEELHRMELFDVPDPAARAGAAANLLAVMVEMELDDAALAAQAALLVHEASRAPGLVDNPEALRSYARILRPAWGGQPDAANAVAERIGGAGSTGEAFVNELRSVLVEG